MKAFILFLTVLSFSCKPKRGSIEVEDKGGADVRPEEVTVLEDLGMSQTEVEGAMDEVEELEESEANETPQYFSFQFKGTNRCLDVEKERLEDNVRLLSWNCHREENQIFQKIEVGDGTFLLKNILSKKCMSLRSISKEENLEIVQVECINSDVQKFREFTLDAGFVFFKNVYSGLCVDHVEGTDRVIQYACHGEDNQLMSKTSHVLNVPEEAP